MDFYPVLEPTEQMIVNLLKSSSGQFILQSTIRETVWPAGASMSSSLVRFYIFSIRKKLNFPCIETNRRGRREGLGYKWIG